MPTLQDLLDNQAELQAKFGNGLGYANASRTQFSIARHYGGCKINGHQYLYNHNDDSLIREDVVKWLVKKKKQRKGQ